MKKIGILIVVLVIALLLAFLFLNSTGKTLTQKEKEEALTKILGRKPQLGNEKEPTGNTEYKGKYVSFLYPARAKIYVLKVNGEVKKDNWNLDSLNFDLSDPRATVLVTVSQAPGGVTSISDYPGVKLRQTQPGLYQDKEILVNNHSGLVFEKKDNLVFEKTAFFYNNSKIYVFSIQGSDVEGIEELFKNLMSSVKFLP